MTGSFEEAIKIIKGLQLRTFMQPKDSTQWIALERAVEEIEKASEEEINMHASQFEGTREEYNKTIMEHDL